MKRLLVLLFLTSLPAQAVPVVAQFTQGSLTSHTETTSKISEVITSVDFNTGWQYSVTGVNVQNSGESISPNATNTTTQTVNGITSTWTGLNASEKPNWTISTPGQAFQFTETYSGPGLSTQTTVVRDTEVTSVTDTVSIFQQ